MEASPQVLGQIKGDASADKPKLRDELRSVLRELGLPKVVDLWLRLNTYCVRAQVA